MKQKLKVESSGNKTIVTADIEWKYAKIPNTRRVVGICPMLGITLEADSVQELFSLIPESVDCLFKSLAKEGDWDEFLKEMKWTKSESAAFRRNDSAFNLPMRLVPVTSDDLEPAACG